MREWVRDRAKGGGAPVAARHLVAAPRRATPPMPTFWPSEGGEHTYLSLPILAGRHAQFVADSPWIASLSLPSAPLRCHSGIAKFEMDYTAFTCTMRTELRLNRSLTSDLEHHRQLEPEV